MCLAPCPLPTRCQEWCPSRFFLSNVKCPLDELVVGEEWGQNHFQVRTKTKSRWVRVDECFQVSVHRKLSQYFQQNEFILSLPKSMEKSESFLKAEGWTNWSFKIPADALILGHCLPKLQPKSSLPLALWVIVMTIPVRHTLHPACPVCWQETWRSLSFFKIFFEKTWQKHFFNKEKKIKCKGDGKITFCGVRYQNRSFVRTKYLLKCEKFLEDIF